MDAVGAEDEEPIQPVAQPSVIHTDATCDKNPVEIVNGAKGERVINLQKVLAKLGLDPGPVDGKFKVLLLPSVSSGNSKRAKDYK